MSWKWNNPWDIVRLKCVKCEGFGIRKAGPVTVYLSVCQGSAVEEECLWLKGCSSWLKRLLGLFLERPDLQFRSSLASELRHSKKRKKDGGCTFLGLSCAVCYFHLQVLISYIDLLYPTDDRNNRLRESYYFTCECQECKSRSMVRHRKKTELKKEQINEMKWIY